MTRTLSNDSGGSPWEPGTVLPGGYCILRGLGRGGMGTVYLVARDTYRGETLHFAVKIIRDRAMKHEKRQDAFIRELRNWIDLPEHPNLTRCRFFQTIHDRIAIFAEYVDAGSLTDWVRAGKPSAMKAIWDVAIQSARGLAAAHACGMLHLDVKPSNMLMTGDGVLKMTDFGLSIGMPDRIFEGPKKGSRTSSQGMTPAFASPEQMMDRPLNHATDQWSWAATILYLFTGSVTWNYGIFAGRTFRALAAKGVNAPIPGPISEVLDRCFSDVPEKRWPGMAEIAAFLEDRYEIFFGEPYFRDSPVFVIPPREEVKVMDDPVSHAETEIDALTERARSVVESGDDRLEQMPGRKGSLRGRLLVNLERLNRLERIFAETLPHSGSPRHRDYLKTLILKAEVMRETDNIPGAEAELDRELGHHASVEGIMDTAVWLDLGVILLNNAGNLKIITGKFDQALPFFQKAKHCSEQQLDPVSPADTPEDAMYNLCWSRLNLSVVLGRLKRFEESVEEASETIEHLTNAEGMMGEEKRLKLLAGTLTNQAASLGFLDKDGHAALLFMDAGDIVESLVLEHHRTDLTHRLVQCRLNAANAFLYCGEIDRARSLAYRTLDYIRHMLNANSRATIQQGIFAGEILIHALFIQEKYEKALKRLDRLIEAVEFDIYQRGKPEHFRDLARLYESKAMLFDKTGNDGARANALALRQKVIELSESQ